MAIKFTKHALERMKIRKIAKSEVLDTLAKPDKLDKDNLGNFIAQKIIGTQLLRVFFVEEKEDKIVITSYKTSDMERYM